MIFDRLENAKRYALDIEFYANSPTVWLAVPAGSFAIFFPDDVHAPLGTDGFIHKIVIKVAVE
jgi:beta-galactosidase beta subunit